jgi:hypothetical protein
MRCYTEKFRNKPDNDIIALNLYRFLVRNAVWPTESQLKAMTMVYEDLFKGRSVKDAKMCCMHRVPGARFERSLCVPSIRRAQYRQSVITENQGEVRLTDVLPKEFPERLTKRAVAFHSFATIHMKHDASQIKSE